MSTPVPQGKARVLVSPDGDRVAVLTSALWGHWRILPAAPGEDLTLREADLVGWMPMLGVDELIGLTMHWHKVGPAKASECGHAECCYAEGLHAARADVEDLIVQTESSTWAR